MTTAANPDWAQAVAIFHDRLEGRFLEPVRSLREHTNPAIKEYSGFAIVAIDCLLIETLGQFLHGFDETPRLPPSPAYPRGKLHYHFYKEFMTELATVAAGFDTDDKRHYFYKHFRCGLLHQAQTKKKSRIRFGEPTMVGYVDPADQTQGLIVDREKLHDAILKDVEAYEKLLLAGNDQTKRDDFVKKMDFITR